MNNYGEEIIENNKVIGYKINDNEAIEVKKLINESGVE